MLRTGDTILLLLDSNVPSSHGHFAQLFLIIYNQCAHLFLLSLSLSLVVLVLEYVNE